MLDQPRIMGILNVTPDSFSDGGQYNTVESALRHAGKMLEEGATFIDVGGYSSRPGATDISAGEELERVLPIVKAIRREYPTAILSCDTFRVTVAQALLEEGVHLINDITAGSEEGMFDLAAEYKVPMVLMHMQGNPQTMQVKPHYADVVAEVSAFLVERMQAAESKGVTDLIVDPGFGFGKTIEHNYALFRALPRLALLGRPLLVGISRKSMIWRLVEADPSDVGDLTTALHLKALEAGASILRVHDVRAASRAIKLHRALAHGAF